MIVLCVVYGYVLVGSPSLLLHDKNKQNNKQK